MKKFKKILLYDFSENKDFIKKLEDFSDEIKLVITKDDYQNDLKKEDFDGVDCFITNVFDNFYNSFFEESSVKYIFTMFTDTSMFDINFLNSKNIQLHNIKGQATQGVCEFSLSILLNIYRKTSLAQNFSKNGGEGFFDFKGREIFGKQVGIIGMGNIGNHFKLIIEGLGAKVEYYSRHSKSMDIEKIFEFSDIIFISHPLDKEDNNLYGKKLLNKCKNGVVILNPSRVEKFNLDELYDFLNERNDAVFWQDEAINDIWKQNKERFLKLENFIITPGCAFFTEENPKRVQNLVLNNFKKI